MRLFAPLLLLAGCYSPPTLPLVDEVPIVASNRCASAREAIVACVIDGDTFDVGQCGEGGERIRMLGIDAPEIAHPPEPTECWADNAHEELRRKIEGRTVFLTFDKDCVGVFGRTLAYVWLGARSGGGVDESTYEFVNDQLIRDGHVYIFDEEFGDLLYRDDFLRSRDLAQALGVGLWGACESGI